MEQTLNPLRQTIMQTSVAQVEVVMEKTMVLLKARQ
jgi:hypothetical protein